MAYPREPNKTIEGLSIYTKRGTPVAWDGHGERIAFFSHVDEEGYALVYIEDEHGDVLTPPTVGRRLGTVLAQVGWTTDIPPEMLLAMRYR